MWNHAAASLCFPQSHMQTRHLPEGSWIYASVYASDLFSLFARKPKMSFLFVATFWLLFATICCPATCGKGRSPAYFTTCMVTAKGSSHNVLQCHGCVHTSKQTHTVIKLMTGWRADEVTSWRGDEWVSDSILIFLIKTWQRFFLRLTSGEWILWFWHIS